MGIFDKLFGKKKFCDLCKKEGKTGRIRKRILSELSNVWPDIFEESTNGWMIWKRCSSVIDGKAEYEEDYKIFCPECKEKLLKYMKQYGDEMLNYIEEMPEDRIMDRGFTLREREEGGKLYNIGCKLNELGGEDLMRLTWSYVAYHLVRERTRYHRFSPRSLESIWDGIGTWWG